jgi:hypothetical protein
MLNKSLSIDLKDAGAAPRLRGDAHDGRRRKASRGSSRSSLAPNWRTAASTLTSRAMLFPGELVSAATGMNTSKQRQRLLWRLKPFHFYSIMHDLLYLDALCHRWRLSQLVVGPQDTPAGTAATGRRSEREIRGRRAEPPACLPLGRPGGRPCLHPGRWRTHRSPRRHSSSSLDALQLQPPPPPAALNTPSCRPRCAPRAAASTPASRLQYWTALQPLLAVRFAATSAPRRAQCVGPSGPWLGPPGRAVGESGAASGRSPSQCRKS